MILVAPKMSELAWHTCSRESTRSVSVAYAMDAKRGGYWKHTQDAEAGAITFEWLSFEDAEGPFEPWNNLVPHGSWMRLWNCDRCGKLAICNVAEDGDSVLCGACS